MKDERIRKLVRKKYRALAKEGKSCCGPTGPCECAETPEAVSRKIGYTAEEMKSAPEGANLGMGCGNPVALASLKEGEVVLDLGSGGGFDCFLAAKRVGERGKVIGVDMTPEMLEKARANARKGGYRNVEFRLGEIENLPAADGSVDVIISNCVINLSPDKERVFDEAYRVLRPGGRLMVSDIVLLGGLPNFLKDSAAALTGCVAGAMLKDDYIKAIKKAGFKDVSILGESNYPITSLINSPEVKAAIRKHRLSRERVKRYARMVRSVKLSGIK